MTLNLACQEHEVPGETLEEKWELLAEAGFHGIELHGRDQAFADRLPELRRAVAAGVPLPSVCLISEQFIGDFDAGVRAAAVANMKTLLTVIAEIGGRGAITPAAFGRFSAKLPPFTPPVPVADSRKWLAECLAELGEHAGRQGVTVFLEPLNRYEDHLLNTLGQAVELIEEIGSPHIQVMADLFHMSIDEDVMADALRDAAPHLGHVHLADSNRAHPGTGHTDFGPIVEALEDLRFDGFLAMECAVRGDRRAAFAQVAGVINGSRAAAA